MIIGKMDRRILIEYPVTTYNTHRDEVIVWTKLAEVWAQKIEGTVNERFLADSRRAQRMVVFRMRYRNDITQTMRISFVPSDGQYYNVLGIKEIGRREALDVDCEYMEATQDGL